MSASHKFKYRPSFKIVSWACHFDSLTELKYAISIRDEYEFLRDRVIIRYNQGTLQPTDYLNKAFKSYTPDFLIRHKTTLEAFLVEIKPRAFEGNPQVAKRKELSEKYIKMKGYDWKYKVVFDDEIILTVEQLEDFEECAKLKSKSAYKTWFEQYNRKFDRSVPSMLKNAPTSAQTRFVMYGTTFQPNNWRQS